MLPRMKQPEPKPSSAKTEQIAFRVDPAFRDELEKAAASDQRTLSQWIVVTLRRALDRK